MTQRMTRKETAAFLRQRGFPIGNSTLNKLCMPSSGQGPLVAAWWGRRPLYDPADALAWAEARVRPAQNRVSKPGIVNEQINSDTAVSGSASGLSGEDNPDAS